MNEWGKVKKVIVGTATGAKYFPDDTGVRHVDYADRPKDANIPNGEYSQTIIDEANEDLDAMNTNICVMSQTTWCQTLTTLMMITMTIVS